MDFETQHVLHLLINRLQSGEHPISSENGVVDFPLLSALTSNTEGWIGLVCQELLEAFQYSESDVRSAVHLEKTATILIAWSAALRLKQNKQLEIMDLLQSIPKGKSAGFMSQQENIQQENAQQENAQQENTQQERMNEEKISEYPSSVNDIFQKTSQSPEYNTLQQIHDEEENIKEENIKEENIKEEKNVEQIIEQVNPEPTSIEEYNVQRDAPHRTVTGINSIDSMERARNILESNSDKLNKIEPNNKVNNMESNNIDKSNVVYVKVPNIRSTLRGILRFPDLPSPNTMNSNSETSPKTLKISELDFSSVETLRQVEGLEVYVPCLYRSYSILEVMIVPSPYEESVQQPIVEGISEYSMNDSLQDILEIFRRSAK